MIYTVTFNPAIDYIVHIPKMQVGCVNRSGNEEIYFGGKGINVSFVLNELGIKSKALGFVAGFTGDAIEKGVTERGIEADFIHLEKGFSRINVKIKSGSETELNGQGPQISENAIEMLFEKLRFLESGDTIVLADHSKFDKISSVTFAELKKAEIITDRVPDKKYFGKTSIKEVV